MSSNNAFCMDDIDSQLYSQIHYTNLSPPSGIENTLQNSSENLQYKNSFQPPSEYVMNSSNLSRGRYWSTSTHFNPTLNNIQYNKYNSSHTCFKEQNEFSDYRDLINLKKYRYIASKFNHNNDLNPSSIPFSDQIGYLKDHSDYQYNNIKSNFHFNNVHNNNQNRQCSKSQTVVCDNSSVQNFNVNKWHNRTNYRKRRYGFEDSHDLFSSNVPHIPKILIDYNLNKSKENKVFRPFEYYIKQSEFIMHALNCKETHADIRFSQYINENTDDQSSKNIFHESQSLSFNTNEQLQVPDDRFGKHCNQISHLERLFPKSYAEPQPFNVHYQNESRNICSNLDSLYFIDTTPTSVISSENNISQPSSSLSKKNDILPNIIVEKDTLTTRYSISVVESENNVSQPNSILLENNNILSNMAEKNIVRSGHSTSIVNSESNIFQPNHGLLQKNNISSDIMAKISTTNIKQKRKNKQKKNKKKFLKKSIKKLKDVSVINTTLKIESKTVHNNSNQIQEIISLEDSSSGCDDVIEIALPPAPVIDITSETDDISDSEDKLPDEENPVDQDKFKIDQEILSQKPQESFIDESCINENSSESLIMPNTEISNTFTSPSCTKVMRRTEKRVENVSRISTPESVSRNSDISCDDFIDNESPVPSVDKNALTLVFNIEEQPILNENTLENERNMSKNTITCMSRISDTSSDDFMQDELAIFNREKDCSPKENISETRLPVDSKLIKSKKVNKNQVLDNNESLETFSTQDVYETESSSDIIDIITQNDLIENIDTMKENNVCIPSTIETQTCLEQTKLNCSLKQKRYEDLDLNSFENLITPSQKATLKTDTSAAIESDKNLNDCLSKSLKKPSMKRKKDPHTNVSFTSKVKKCKQLKTKSTSSLNTTLNLNLTDSSESSDEAETDGQINNISINTITATDNVSVSDKITDNLESNLTDIDSTNSINEHDFSTSTVCINESNTTVEEINVVNNNEITSKEEFVIILDEFNPNEANKVIDLCSDEEKTYKPMSVNNRKRKHSESNQLIELSDDSLPSYDSVIMDDNVNIVLNVNENKFSTSRNPQPENESVCNKNNLMVQKKSDNKNTAIDAANISSENNQSISVVSPSERSFEKNWMLDRNCFYNDSWGEETFDVNELRRNMSISPNAWQMPLDQYNFREVSKSSVRCLNCRQLGHRKNSCPRPVKSCGFCGSKKHQEIRCTMACCLNCLTPNRGGDFIDFCNYCYKDKNTVCYLCAEKGHIKDRCPSVWRQYHSTVTNGPLNTYGNEVNTHKRKNWWCSGCAKQGHLISFCNEFKYKTDMPFYNPFINNYKDVYRDCPPTKKRKIDEKFDYEKDPWSIHQATYDKENESFLLSAENGIKIVPLVKKKKKTRKSQRKKKNADLHNCNIIENDPNLENISDNEDSLLTSSNPNKELSAIKNNAVVDNNNEKGAIENDNTNKQTEKREDVEIPQTNVPVIFNLDVSVLPSISLNDVPSNINNSEKNVIQNNNKRSLLQDNEVPQTNVPITFIPNVPLPSFIPLSDVPNDVKKPKKNVVKNNNKQLLVQDNTVSNSETSNSTLQPERNIAKIVISSEEKKKMLTVAGANFIKTMYNQFNVDIFFDTESNSFNCLHIEGTLKSQYQVQEQLRNFLKCKEIKKDSLINIPKKMSALKKFLSTFIARINKLKCDDLTTIYELAKLHTKEIESNLAKSNYIRSSKKKQNVRFFTLILNKLIRKLNLILFGKAELEDGKKHLMFLKDFIKESKNINENAIVSLNKRTPIAVSYEYFFTIRDFEVYNQLMYEYDKTNEISRCRTNNSLSKSNLNSYLGKIEQLLCINWIFRNVALKKMIMAIRKKISKQNVLENDLAMINLIFNLYTRNF